MCILNGEVLKVGVTCTRFVSLPNARPWVIHAYKNIKGRGVHVDEDVDNSVPTDQIDENWIDPSHQGEKSYFYTESDANSSSVKQFSSRQNPKRRKEDTGKEIEPKIEKQNVPADTIDSDIRAVSKRKLSVPTDTGIAIETKKRQKSEPVTKEESTESKCKNIAINAKSKSSSDETTEEIKTDRGSTGGTVDTNTICDTKKQDIEATEIDNDSKGGIGANEVNDSNTERRLRIKKRKYPEDEEHVIQNKAPSVSTYDKVRLVIQPWRKPEGGINKGILKMMLESVMLYLMMNPGSPEDALVRRYSPYLQPMILRNIVDVLEDIGCVYRKFINSTKPSLFSKPSLPTVGGEEEEGSIVVMVPTEDCVIKLGLFGQEVFPQAKWPDNTYPREKK
ncbi:general transcription factor 3C polypeptide 1-like [Ruditapes philippinarum]|uniref:general transcription factor 3C polypeptide 1-like n=1 Tax=Ruditapes philippinarum TaxID=129788 RepID=UPI00295A5B14|nr:general transcription factor 3C polypeptide 1-like [Ruditapes philippinarum]